MKILLLFLFVLAPAWAHEGHDHGAEAKPVSGSLAPRFASISDAFDLVGVLAPDGVTLYLNRRADLAPVSGAEIEIEGALKGRAVASGPTAPGAYRLQGTPPRVGQPLTFTVTAGESMDLLTAVSPAPTFDRKSSNLDISQRLADGSLFVPRAVQNLLGMRVHSAQAGKFPRAVELSGRVIADPATGGRVQAAQSGVIEAGPRGLALIGQAVKKGEVLAYLVPALDAATRAERQADSASVAGQIAVLEDRLARYQKAPGIVPRRDIEQVQLERDGLRARRQALQTGLAGRVALTAPVAGVVAASHVAIGQVVSAKDLLYEIVDPQRLAVEAQIYDTQLVAGFGRAVARVGEVPVRLEFVGIGRSLREQALPVLFRVRTPDAPLALGQTLKVQAETKSTQSGVAIPGTAVTRNSANEPMVWVQEGAERFLMRRVKTVPLDAERVLVTAGLAGGERIVAVAAQSLGQIR
ncbi:MAG: efflux RND transporter periplasmic adaptor subunit [Rhodocyclaceae bacterium]|nr:efflux RND transporter periplasmic adaptor subunit [Rhodocyclaceae bacterium]MDZ4214530.1 efflux RND transporter periplasmic adaptor subunit [Rhodocyclaceae bacterium]